MSANTSVKHHIYDEYFYEGMLLTADTLPLWVVKAVPGFSFEGDVLVTSYPKTGTTWVQEITWLIAHDNDRELADKVPIYERFRYLEIMDMDNKPEMENIAKLPHPRLVKSHLPASFFARQLAEENIKIIVPVRNPKDMLVSYYYFYKAIPTLGSYTGTWNEFYDDLFVNDHLLYGDYFRWYESWLKADHQEKILLVKYEDLKKDLAQQVRRIATFLGKDLPNSAVRSITDSCTFDVMKTNPMANYSTAPESFIDQKVSKFMRKGKVGDWKSHMSEEQSQKLDQLYQLHLASNGLNLEFDENARI